MTLILILMALLLINLAIQAGLLWLSCRLCRARRAGAAAVPVGYWRSVVAVLVVTVVNVGLLTAPAIAGVGYDELALPVAVAQFVLSLFLTVLSIGLVLRLKVSKTLLVSLVWVVLSTGYAFGFAVTARAALVEAFVIPTGGMAESLRGYHKQITCPSCGFAFAVNCSDEVDAPSGVPPRRTTSCTCPNCRQAIRLVDAAQDGRGPRGGVVQGPAMFDGDAVEYREALDPGWTSGDRILVGKWLLNKLLPSPRRLDIITFVYPEGEERGQTFHYVERLVGLPGETIAIHGGDIYRLPPGEGLSYDDSHVPEKDRWKPEHTHPDDEKALRLFQTDKFAIIRKPPETLLKMRHIVYDHDHPAQDLKGEKWRRWAPAGQKSGWESAGEHGFRFTSGKEAEKTDWLRYRHRLRGDEGKPSLITDFSGYNSQQPDLGRGGENWVGDLILECEAEIAGADGTISLALTNAGERYEARWELPSGDCTLVRLRKSDKGAEEEVLETKPTGLRQGTHRLRFANIDRRLVVWVDDDLPFGEGVAYDRREARPTADDLEPAGIGARGAAVTVRKIKLWRDVYYTCGNRDGPDIPIEDWTNPPDEATWKELPVRTMYVQPGHYLVLGDNSPRSADSRYWGLVPRRLLLGRALLVYYPFPRARLLR